MQILNYKEALKLPMPLLLVYPDDGYWCIRTYINGLLNINSRL